jgi:hypothetical protein
MDHFDDGKSKIERLPLASESDWQTLDEAVYGFHDSVIKEARWSRKEYVNNSLQMVNAGLPNLWVLIQIQFRDFPAVELIFHGVKEFSITTSQEVEPTFRAGRDGITFCFSGSSNYNYVEAERCEYRILDSSWLGPGPFETPEIELPESSKLRDINNRDSLHVYPPQSHLFSHYL